MKKALVLPLLFLSQYFFAQDASVKWGTLSDKEVKVQIVSYMIKATPFVAIGEDATGKPVSYDWSTYTGFQKFAGDNYVAVGFIKTANHCYLTGTIKKRKEAKIELYFAEISNTGKAIGQPKLIASRPYVVRAKIAGEDYGQFLDKDIDGIILNKDKTILAFITPPTDFATGENDMMTVTVFDENLKTLWDKQLKFPVLDGQISFYDVDLTSNGTLILTSEIERQGKYDKKKESDYVSKLWIYQMGNLVEAPFTIAPNIYPGDFALTEIDSDHIMLAGFYSEDRKASAWVQYASRRSFTEARDGFIDWKAWIQFTSNGTFALTVQLSSGKITAVHHEPFSKELADLLNKPIRFSNASLTPAHHMEVIGLEKSNKGDVLLITGSGGGTSANKYQGSRFYFSVGSDLKTTYETTTASSMRSSGVSAGVYIINRGDKLTLLYNEDQPKYAFNASTIDFKGKEISTQASLPIERGLEFSPNKSYWLSPDKVAVAGNTNAENSGGKRLVYGIVTVK